MKWFVVTCPDEHVVQLDRLLRDAKDVVRVAVTRDGCKDHFAVGYFEPEQSDIFVGIFGLPRGKSVGLSEAVYHQVRAYVEKL